MLRADHESAKPMVACGQVLPGEQVIIVDPETQAILDDDQVGEIWIDSPSVGQGYYQRKEATERTFRAKTACGKGPFLRTGDLGFLYGEQLYVFRSIEGHDYCSWRQSLPTRHRRDG